MEAHDVLVTSLAALDESGLAGLLARRADVTRGVPPRTLDELANRLWNPHGLVEALHGVPLPALQATEAAHALGNGCSLTELAALLDGPVPDAVRRVVDDLVALRIVAVGADGCLALPPALEGLMPSPLGLGRPMTVLLQERSVEEMRTIQAHLGLGRQQNRAATVASLVEYFADPTVVADLLASAPQAVPALLRERTDDAAEKYFVAYDQNYYRLRQEALEWVIAHGLLLGSTYDYDWYLPAEVARALRGRGYRAPFTPDPPVALTRPADRERVERDAAAAASDLSAHLLAVLDHLARSPVGTVKSGGVGTRELTRLAKACDVDELMARLVLELAHAAGLVGVDGATIAVSPDFAAWRSRPPGEQYVAVLRTWWDLARTPTECRDGDGKPVRVLAELDECDGCRAARAALVGVLDVDRAGDLAALGQLAVWQAPFVHLLAQDADTPFATIWREAELLGVLGDGALTSLGQALREGSDDLVRVAALLLPTASDRATFGSDLTAFAVGAPSAHLSALLDSAADRESRGGAITWRFTPATVRRALDEGATADALLDELAAIASGTLPQPLRYLIGDVARQHGNLRLLAPTCCVRSEDVALLAQVAADRKLAKYGLQLLAPTVLAADVPLAKLLDALRRAGYYPVLDAPGPVPDAPARPEPTRSQRARAKLARPEEEWRTALREEAARLLALQSPPSTPPADAEVIELFPRARVPQPRADPTDLAATLLSAVADRGDSAAPAPPGGATEQVLSSLSRSLSHGEIRRLAQAIELGSRVVIEYRAASGSRTRRVIDAPELEGTTIYAWCELRQDERMFTVSGILSVASV